MRKKLIGLGFALILALTTYAPALAHECFIASRSDVGNMAAGTNSQNWVYVGTLADVFGFIGDDAGQALSPSQLEWAVATAQTAGLPNSFAVFINPHVGKGSGVLQGGTPNDGSAKMADGKGVDHIFDWFPTLFSIYAEALGK